MTNARSSPSSCCLSCSLVWRSRAATPTVGYARRLLQAVAHEDAVLVDQRHDVGDGADRGEADGLEQELPQALVDALALARPLADGPRQLERDRGAAQAGERIAAAGQPGMHDRRGARQRDRPSGGGR